MIKYLVLCYAETIFVARGRHIAVLVQRTLRDTGPLLELYLRPNWDLTVPGDDAEYIRSVFDEIRNPEANADPEIFARLAEMSSGCLRAGDKGQCNEDDVKETCKRLL